MAAGSDLLDEVFFNAEVDEKVVSDLVGSLESELTGSGHGNSEVKGRAVGNHIARAGIGGNSSNDQESKMGRAQEVAKAGTGVHGGVVNTRSRGSAEDATITGTTSATGSDTLANHSQGKTAAIVSTLPKHGLKIGSSGVQTLNGGNAMDSHSSGCSTALTATPVASSSASNTSTVTVANTGMVKGHANVILPASSNTVIQTSLVNPQTVVTTSTLGSGPTVTIVRSSMQTAGSAATLNMNNAGLTTAANVVNQPSSAASGSPKTILQTSQTISSAVVTNTGNLTISPAALGKNVVFQTVTRTATPGTVASSPGGIRAIAPQVLAPRLPQTSPNQPNIQNIQLPPGMVLVRSESGQLLMIHQQTLAQMQAHSQSQSAMAPRPATPASMTLGQISSAQAPGTPVMARQVTPASIIKQSSPTPTSMAGTTALQRPQQPIAMGGAATPTGTPLVVEAGVTQRTLTAAAGTTVASVTETMENVKKCKNFLSTLIKLASSGKQSTETATNVKDLVKSLLEGKIEAEDFTSRLYRELNSSPQPFLVPFLKRSLPALRQLTPDSSAFILQSQGPAPCAHLQPAPNKPAKPAAPALQPQQKGTIAKSPQVTLTTSPMVTLRGQPHSRITVGPPQVQLKQLQMLSGAKVSPGYASLAAAAQRTKLKDGVGGTFRDDDDINDVTSMAGVNLSEENARILATNSELVGAVTRSWKDQVFLYAPTLHRRVLDIGRKYGLTELGPEVVTLVSHATQQRLQSLLEKVSEIAQQKNISFKEDGRYAQTSDVRAQLKFFEQLDQMEKQRKEEQEREILLKAAKSRSKQEDPEQLRLKQKAKEMQQQELFQLRQREANLTALAAIGPRKKRKLDSSARGAGAEGSGSSASLSPSSSPGASRHFSRQRITRVNLRDLLFCLENERDTGHSQTLYRGLLK